jgi:phosphoserine phosphatase
MVQAKIGTIALAGPDLLEARLDFDRTMTTNGPKDVTSWDVLGDLLPPWAQNVDQKMYKYYQPRELAHTLTIPEAEEWWNNTLQLYVDSMVNIHRIEDAAGSISLRPATKDFFDTCRDGDIHTTILSAGIKEVIEVVNKHEGIQPNFVMSNSLESDPQTGIITGWDRDKVIHILNKGERGSPQLADIRQRRPNTIIIGDAIEDTSMADDHESGTVLRVRVGDPHKIHPSKIGEYMEESFMAGYDMVRLGDFRPIDKLARFVTITSTLEGAVVS